MPYSIILLFNGTRSLPFRTAACIAHEMGLPVKVVCSVTNDALFRTVYDNDYSIGALNVSIAPAMNIQVCMQCMLYKRDLVFSHPSL